MVLLCRLLKKDMYPGVCQHTFNCTVKNFMIYIFIGLIDPIITMYLPVFVFLSKHAFIWAEVASDFSEF